VPLALQVVLLAVAGLVTVVVPESRPWMLVAGNWSAVLLIGAGLRRHRPEHRLGAWIATLVFMALVAVGNTATLLAGSQTSLTIVATAAGQIAAAVALGGLVGRWKRRRRSSDGTLDMAVLGIVTALYVAELVGAGVEAHGSGLSPLIAFAPAVDCLIIAVLAWIILTRGRVVPALALILVGAVGCLLYDLLCTVNGQRAASLDSPVTAIGLVSFMCFGVGAMHPSMRVLGTPDGEPGRRRGSAQLAMLLPVAVLPVLTLTSGSRFVPSGIVSGVVVLVLTLTFLRAVLVLARTEKQADTDPLTGLLNRPGLHRAWNALTPRPGPSEGGGWLMVVDLDDFKDINDRFGHDTGDQLLVVVGRRLRDVVGHAGVVARHGGDEFIVLLEPGSAAELPDPAQAVIDALDRPVHLAGRTLHVSVSIGLVALDVDRGLGQQLGDADIARYRAKQHRGSAHVLFTAEMRARMVDDLTAGEELWWLLTSPDAADDRLRQLVVHYQPVVAVDTRTITGVEALVRWQHPERGSVPPADFLEIVERDGLGPALDRHVLHVSLRDLRRHDQHGSTRLVLSVNLGLASMCDPDLPAWVAEELRSSGVDPERLRLEITEHDALPDERAITASMHAVVALGCSLSLDDFGVGYTSLAYLHRFPISVLKLDRSLITTSAGRAGLLEGIAALGASLSVTIVAEGIETEDQHQRMRDLGIDSGQGYLYGRPRASWPAFAVDGLDAARRPGDRPAGSTEGDGFADPPVDRSLLTAP
jgi:diguanylate cyclase (GGDEF)-like protein